MMRFLHCWDGQDVETISVLEHRRDRHTRLSPCAACAVPAPGVFRASVPLSEAMLQPGPFPVPCLRPGCAGCLHRGVMAVLEGEAFGRVLLSDVFCDECGERWADRLTPQQQLAALAAVHGGVGGEGI